MASKAAMACQLISWAPPQMTRSWRPSMIRSAAWPMAWAPLAQAPLTVQLAPRVLRMAFRFRVMVEFMALKTGPLPMSRVSRPRRRLSAASTTASQLESQPKTSPVCSFSMSFGPSPAWASASMAAAWAWTANSGMDFRCLRERRPAGSKPWMRPVSGLRKPKEVRSGSETMPEAPCRKAALTVSRSEPRQETMPTPVMATRLTGRPRRSRPRPGR